MFITRVNCFNASTGGADRVVQLHIVTDISTGDQNGGDRFPDFSVTITVSDSYIDTVRCIEGGYSLSMPC